MRSHGRSEKPLPKVFLPMTTPVGFAGRGISCATDARLEPACRAPIWSASARWRVRAASLLKTSSDAGTPPNVMNGSGGMV